MPSYELEVNEGDGTTTQAAILMPDWYDDPWGHRGMVVGGDTGSSAW
jgi:hypothetical protein